MVGEQLTLTEADNTFIIPGVILRLVGGTAVDTQISDGAAPEAVEQPRLIGPYKEDWDIHHKLSDELVRSGGRANMDPARYFELSQLDRLIFSH